MNNGNNDIKSILQKIKASLKKIAIKWFENEVEWWSDKASRNKRVVIIGFYLLVIELYWNFLQTY